MIPSLAAISRGGTPSAANARTCAHSTALRTSCALPSESTTTPIPTVEREPGTPPQWRTFPFLDLAQYWARGVRTRRCCSVIGERQRDGACDVWLAAAAA